MMTDRYQMHLWRPKDGWTAEHLDPLITLFTELAADGKIVQLHIDGATIWIDRDSITDGLFELVGAAGGRRLFNLDKGAVELAKYLGATESFQSIRILTGERRRRDLRARAIEQPTPTVEFEDSQLTTGQLLAFR